MWKLNLLEMVKISYIGDIYLYQKYVENIFT